jgi:ribonuclease HII
MEHPDVEHGVYVANHATIDDMNILQATLLAMTKSVERLPSIPDYVLVDGNRLPQALSVEAKTIVKGLLLSFSFSVFHAP